jgi:hypothetical protein
MTEQPSPDELAEAERALRSVASSVSSPTPGEMDAREVWLIMAEFDRLRLVEQAATALVEHWTVDIPILDTWRGKVGAIAPGFAQKLADLVDAVERAQA